MDKSQSSPGTTGVKLRYGINEFPPLVFAIVLAIQHLFGMFGATVTVPILVNQQAGAEVIPIAVALFTSGIATLWYQCVTGFKSPVYLGSSFAFIAPLATTYTLYDMGAVMTGTLAVGIVYIIAGAIVAKVGTNWLDRILPPVVRGPMILIIGLGLSTSAIGQIGISAGSDPDWRSIFVAAITLVATIAFMVGFRKVLGGFFNVVPFLMAIIVGYAVSLCLGMVDANTIQEAAWIAKPNFHIIGIDWQLDFRGLWTFLPLSLATMSEHIGDHKALSTVVGKDLLKEPGLARTLFGDGGGTAWAPIFGGPANTTYGENTSIVGMTKVASVGVISLAAIFAIILSFNGKLTAAIAAIPGPVLGGVSVMLYGFIGLNGMKDVIQNKVNFGYSRNVAIAAPMLVFGLGGAVLSLVLDGATVFSLSGMSLAAVIGVVINLILPEDREELAEIAAQKEDTDILAAIKADENLLKMARQAVEAQGSDVA